MSPQPEVLLVFSNAPSAEVARTLARLLIERRAAACVNVLAACISTYRWEGSVEESQEVPMLIKTTQANYSSVQAIIEAHHPYGTPEIIAVPVVQGLPSYLDWVTAETHT